MKIPSKQLANLAKLSLLCFSLLLIPAQSYAKDVSFSWTANTSEPLTGYKIYYKTGTDNTPPYEGTGLTEGDSPIVIGKVAGTTITGLSESETYQFTIIAYNDTGNSDYSIVIPIGPAVMPAPVINIMSQN